MSDEKQPTTPPPGSDAAFLAWIHERLQHIHGENPLLDYMHKLRAIIRSLPQDQRTPSCGQGKASLEELRAAMEEEEEEEAPKLTEPQLERWRFIKRLKREEAEAEAEREKPDFARELERENNRLKEELAAIRRREEERWANVADPL